MATLELSIDEQCTYLCSGYVRNIERIIVLSNPIPVGILNIINDWYNKFHQKEHFEIEEEQFSDIYSLKNEKKLNDLDEWHETAKFNDIYRISDNKLFSLKKIELQQGDERAQYVLAEISILSKFSFNPHPNIIEIIHWFNTKKCICIIIEHIKHNQSCFEQLIKRKTFTEIECKDIIKQICGALIYIHQQNVVHRDLKPDVLIYNDHKTLKLISFEICGIFKPGSALHTPCGTAHYAAPEVLTGKPYNQKVDLWSIGVVMYIFLCGFPPFFDVNGNNKRLYELIKSGNYKFPEPHWNLISHDAKNLITHLLEKDVHKRYSAKQVLLHEWISSNDT